MIHSRAGSTARKYLTAFRRWKSWAESRDFPTFPVKEVHLVLYMQSVGEHTNSKAMVEEAFNAISWFHVLGSQPSPTESAFAKATLQGLQKDLAKPVRKKLPVTVDMLAAIVDDTERTGTLANLRLSAACLLSYAAFLRFDELVHVKAKDITFNDKFISIYIPRSKTDQLWQGNVVLVARTGSRLCPVTMLEKYMSRAGVGSSDDRFIFRSIVKTKRGERLREIGNMSYTRLRECFKEKLEFLGFAAQNYGLHSLRAGGATAAANNQVADRLFKKHGRWRSEAAKDGYIEDSLQSRLSVSNNLGL